MNARSKDTTVVIIKQGFSIDNRLGDDTPVPEITILANEAGLKWLGEFFDQCASEARQLHGKSPEIVVETHRHLDVTMKPFDYDRCDHLEMRIVPFDDQSRGAIFEKYQVSTATAKRDGLPERNEAIERAVQAYLGTDR